MMDLNETLFELTSLLEESRIPYAVMGGLAVRVYSIPRATQDVDLTVTVNQSQLAQLLVELENREFSVPEAYRSGWVDSVADMPLVKLRRYVAGRGVDVDLFLTETSFQQSLMQRRRSAEIEGHAVQLVSPEDLILLKLVASRPRDLIDVQDILFTQGDLDESYLHHWAKELDVLPKLKNALGGTTE